MSRCQRILAVCTVLLALGVAYPALAGVPHMVFGEDFTATWCQYCPRADCALAIVDSIYANQFFHMETHGQFSPPDPFVTTESTARVNRYNVTGYPTVNFDGSIQEVGADVCPTMVGIYSSDITTAMNNTGGVSPVQITGTLTVDPVAKTATLTANFTLLDPNSFTSHQATLYIYEDSVACCTGYGGQHVWNRVTRMVRSTPLSLTQVGQVGTVTQVYNFGSVTPTVTPAHLHPFALYEQIGGAKTIIQSTDFVPPDYSLDIPTRIMSVPGGNGTALFTGTVSNIGNVADVITLTVSNGFGWPTDFQVQGDPNWYQSDQVPLGPGDSRSITVRVQTDGTRRIGAGSFSGVSQNTNRATHIGLQLFNGSPSVLLVNEDNNTNQGALFGTGLTNLGYLYNQVAGAAGSATMHGYDVVIWQTGYQTSTLSQADEDALSSYLDNGGRLFLSSMDFLTSVTLPNNFVTNYLGIGSYTVNTHANQAVGVNGDPITNGMNMPLTWPQPNVNRVDTVNPGAGAATIFYSETNNSNAIRNQGSTFRSVFSTIWQGAFPTSGTSPNTSQDVIGQTVAWLLGMRSTDVPATAAVAPKLLLQSGLNPARSYAQMRFTLGNDNAGQVRLSFLDAGGRVVRTLQAGNLKPGTQVATWDLRDDGGRQVPNGFYFARLYTASGSASAKVVVLH